VSACQRKFVKTGTVFQEGVGNQKIFSKKCIVLLFAIKLTTMDLERAGRLKQIILTKR